VCIKNNLPKKDKDFQFRMEEVYQL
jgi:hypothetical protein